MGCRKAVQRHLLRPPPRGRRPYRGRRHRAARCAAPSLEPRPLLCLTACRRPYGRSLKVDLDGKTATVRTRARRMRMPTAPCRPNAPLRARAALHVVEQCANDRVRDAALHADGIVSVCTGEMFIVLAISVAALPRHRPHYHPTTTNSALFVATRTSVGDFFSRCPSARRAPPSHKKLPVCRADCS